MEHFIVNEQLGEIQHKYVVLQIHDGRKYYHIVDKDMAYDYIHLYENDPSMSMMVFKIGEVVFQSRSFGV